MAKFNTGSATIDKFLEIKKADEGFYQYLGEDTFISLVKSAHPADLKRLNEAVKELKEDGHNMLTYRIRRRDGKYRWILAELEYEPIEFGGEQLISINIQDIQALEKEMNTIKNINMEYDEYFGMLDEILFMYNIEEDVFKVFYGNSKQTVNLIQGSLAEWILQVRENKLIDKEYQSVFEELCNDLKNGSRSFKHELLSGAFSAGKEMELHLIKGKTIRDSFRERKVIGCISLLSQNSKKKKANYSAEYNKDAGTDLLNKKAITDYAKRAIATKPDYNVHIAIIDLDNFKNINDTFGHMFGDEVLATAAEILKDAVAGNGVVGRIGGDEMMIVLEKVDPHAGLRGILRTIRSNIEWAYKGKKEGVDLTCSIGVASYPCHAQRYEDLFLIADKMLYRAKKKGKNRYIIYTPEVHGDVTKEDIEEDKKGIEKLKINKEGLIMRLTELLLHKKILPYESALEDTGIAFDLDEINIFYGNINRLTMDWMREPDKEERSIQYVFANEFENLFNENGVAVVDSTANIDGIYPKAHQYLAEKNIKAAIVYKMHNEKHEGYIAFYKKSSATRKWSDSDKAYLGFVGKIIELSLDDR